MREATYPADIGFFPPGSYHFFQNQLSESMREADERYESLRIKSKWKSFSEKARVQAETDLTRAMTELNDLQSLRTESKHRRKLAVNQLRDQANRLQQYCEENELLTAKVSKLTLKLKKAIKACEADVDRTNNLLKKVASFDMTIVELNEANEESNKIRASLASNLRKTEDELAELLESQEDYKLAVEKSEKVSENLFL
ncbi:unnamed protein product [Cylicocyclus nassatus]|uniref:Uncharacterized protein n=1 Tax=Cylicocyclus nassatus TaxID=53992 RepID=A0AA36DNV3_CYLNA|nr:unnamed protein product [Cylicocyclus nassatus]